MTSCWRLPMMTFSTLLMILLAVAATSDMSRVLEHLDNKTSLRRTAGRANGITFWRRHVVSGVVVLGALEETVSSLASPRGGHLSVWPPLSAVPGAGLDPCRLRPAPCESLREWC